MKLVLHTAMVKKFLCKPMIFFIYVTFCAFFYLLYLYRMRWKFFVILFSKTFDHLKNMLVIYNEKRSRESYSGIEIFSQYGTAKNYKLIYQRNFQTKIQLQKSFSFIHVKTQHALYIRKSYNRKVYSS